MKYIVVDNVKYLDYYLNNLKEQFIPIVTEYYFYNYLKLRGVCPIGIYDCLPVEKINKLAIEVSRYVDEHLKAIDDANRLEYEKCFGDPGINLVSVITGYFFKRSIINSCLFLKGIEAIVNKYKITNLAYLSDGVISDICTNRDFKAFIFPDDICFRALKEFASARQIGLDKLIIAKQAAMAGKKKMSITGILKNALRKVIVNWKRRIPLGKKNILTIMPLYEMSEIMKTKVLEDNGLNVIRWDPDHCALPPIGWRGKFKLRRAHAPQLKLDLAAQKIDSNISLSDFNLGSFITPLLQQYVNNKLSEIVAYWAAVKGLDDQMRIDALVWGNPPLRYPGAIINEYCRSKQIPVIGMQHGGVYGSNESMFIHYDTDYSKCDYFLSYGFLSGDIKEQLPAGKKLPEIIPAGSPIINKLRNELTVGEKKETDVLYALGVRNSFIMTPHPTTPENLLVEMQSKIIELLERYKNNKIIISCPPSYDLYPIKPVLEYLGRKESHIKVFKNISFMALLKRYQPKLIILDGISTPLNQALATQSAIVVYNDPLCLPLTRQAHQLLSKRARVCSSDEQMVDVIKEALEGKDLGLDLGNDEFLRKYCIYDGQSEKNIIGSLLRIMGKNA